MDDDKKRAPRITFVMIMMCMEAVSTGATFGFLSQVLYYSLLGIGPGLWLGGVSGLLCGVVWCLMMTRLADRAGRWIQRPARSARRVIIRRRRGRSIGERGTRGIDDSPRLPSTAPRADVRTEPRAGGRIVHRPPGWGDAGRAGRMALAAGAAGGGGGVCPRDGSMRPLRMLAVAWMFARLLGRVPRPVEGYYHRGVCPGR